MSTRKKPLNLHKYRLNGELVEAIARVLDEHAGKVSLAEAIGALEIIKHDLLISQYEDK